MRISDWSSDVCSSDLPLARPRTGSADRPQLEGLAHGGLDLTEREALQEPQDLDVFALAGGAVVAGPQAGFQEAAQGGEGLGQVPLLERGGLVERSEEHTSALPSLMRTSYAVFCLKKTTNKSNKHMTEEK